MTMVLIVSFITLVVSLALLSVSICRLRRSRKARRARPKFSRLPMDLRLPEDPCDSCPRWSECNGIAKGEECPWR